jgi:hypothetical protein
VQIFFLVWIFNCLKFIYFVFFFVIAEKKEEKEKHDKQRNKSNSIASGSSNHTQCNGDGQYSRTSINTNINDETASANSSIEDTWIHELFQGTLVSTTKCLNCETVRKEKNKLLGNKTLY